VTTSSPDSTAILRGIGRLGKAAPANRKLGDSCGRPGEGIVARARTYGTRNDNGDDGSNKKPTAPMTIAIFVMCERGADTRRRWWRRRMRWRTDDSRYKTTRTTRMAKATAVASP
jgi:hypothetical protein